MEARKLKSVDSPVTGTRTRGGEALQRSIENQFDFVDSLRARVWKTASSNPNLAEAALCTLSVLQQIIRREAGEVRFEEGIADSLLALCAEPPVEKTVSALYEACRQVLFQIIRKDREVGIRALQLLESLDMILEWYAHRTASLESESTIESSSSLGSEIVTGLSVVHDVVRRGFSGFLVKSKCILDSRGGEVLWAKITLSCRGVPLKPRQGWESWSDGMQFAVLCPIDLSDHRRIGRHVIDDLEFFVPYEAFEIPPGLKGRTTEAICTVMIEDRGLKRVCAKGAAVQLRLVDSSDTALVSPQELEIWNKSVANYVEVDQIEVSPLRVEGETLGVSISGELTIFGGLAGAKLSLRVLDSEGNLIKATDTEAFGGRAGEFGISTDVEIKTLALPISFRFEIPFSSLALTSDSNNYLLEVTLTNDENRVLCGTVEPLEIIP